MTKHIQYRLLALLTICFSLTFTVADAQTGLWTHNFSFNGRTEKITFNVPANYNPSKKYQLFVCLMGQGYTTENYGSAAWPGVGFYIDGSFGDVIMAVPGDGSANSGYFQAEDFGIIDATIDEAKKIYAAIDPGKVFLQGFSFGAYTALKTGLANPTKYRGMMIYSLPPGPSDTDGDMVISDPEINNAFNYSGITQIALCMAVGSNDPNPWFSNAVFSKLYAINGWKRLKTVSGMGHVPPDETLALAGYNCMLGEIAVLPVEEGKTFSSEIEVYPNPSNGIFHITIPSVEKHEISVFDITGRQINGTVVTMGDLTLDLGGEPKGVYIVKIENEKGSTVKKVVLTD